MKRANFPGRQQLRRESAMERMNAHPKLYSDSIRENTQKAIEANQGAHMRRPKKDRRNRPVAAE